MPALTRGARARARARAKSSGTDPKKPRPGALAVTTRAAATRNQELAQKATEQAENVIDLPAELRHMVYEHLMEVITLSVNLFHRDYVRKSRNDKKDADPSKGLMALFRTSKACHAEVKDLWPEIYAKATFVFVRHDLKMWRPVELASPHKSMSATYVAIAKQLLGYVKNIRILWIIGTKFWKDGGNLEEKTDQYWARLSLPFVFRRLRKLSLTLTVSFDQCPKGDSGTCISTHIDGMERIFDTYADFAGYLERNWNKLVEEELHLGDAKIDRVAIDHKGLSSGRSGGDEVFGVEIDVRSLRDSRKIQQLKRLNFTIKDIISDNEGDSSDDEVYTCSYSDTDGDGEWSDDTESETDSSFDDGAERSDGIVEAEDMKADVGMDNNNNKTDFSFDVRPKVKKFRSRDDESDDSDGEHTAESEFDHHGRLWWRRISPGKSNQPNQWRTFGKRR